MARVALTLETGDSTWVLYQDPESQRANNFRNCSCPDSSAVLDELAKVPISFCSATSLAGDSALIDLSPSAASTTSTPSMITVVTKQSGKPDGDKVAGLGYQAGGKIISGASALANLEIAVVESFVTNKSTPYQPQLGIGSKNSRLLKSLKDNNMINTMSFGLYLGERGQTRNIVAGSIVFGGIDIAKFSIADVTTLPIDPESHIPPSQIRQPALSSSADTHTIWGLQGLSIDTDKQIDIAQSAPVNFDFNYPFINLLGHLVDEVKKQLERLGFTITETKVLDSTFLYLDREPPDEWGLTFSFITNRTINVKFSDILAQENTSSGKKRYQLMIQGKEKIVFGSPFFRAAYAFLDYEVGEISFAPLRRGATEQHIIEVHGPLNDPSVLLNNVNPANIRTTTSTVQKTLTRTMQAQRETHATTVHSETATSTSSQKSDVESSELAAAKHKLSVSTCVAVSFGALWVGTTAALALVVFRYRRLRKQDSLMPSPPLPPRRRSRRTNNPVSEPFLPGSYGRNMGDRVRDLDGTRRGYGLSRHPSWN
ncbi:hypothetical protein TWF481_001455 [Arthrobotrys musiformis]|uniref:Peptidase A1 domain-containing protein n=1 Tax=Arthrobotrys musiformis TaxID=47236 RepID=A0AAV9WSW3_9PEZI